MQVVPTSIDVALPLEVWAYRYIRDAQKMNTALLALFFFFVVHKLETSNILKIQFQKYITKSHGSKIQLSTEQLLA